MDGEMLFSDAICLVCGLCIRVCDSIFHLFIYLVVEHLNFSSSFLLEIKSIHDPRRKITCNYAYASFSHRYDHRNPN